MKESLLEILAEPGTHARLDLKVTRHEGPSIEEGSLTSQKTGKVYPIVNGIARFVPQTEYTDSFGKQWNRFRTTQLDSVNGAKYSTERFDTETGWTAADLDDKLVLDAGCGAGRFAEVAASRGARIVALDMSSAVDAARMTLGKYPRAEIVQASLLDPPFVPGSFAFAYCLGVIQHTPAPEAAIASVVRQLAPGGKFAFAIYARRPWTKLNVKYLLRPITRRMPQDMLLGSIEKTMPVLFPLTDTLFRLPAIGKVARFVIPVANYVEKDGTFTREQRYEETILDTFDMLSPRYDSPLTWQEVDGVLKQSARDWQFRSRVPVVVRGTC